MTLTLFGLLAACGSAAATNSLERLTIPAMWGEIVVEYSLTNDYARAYDLHGTNSSSPGKRIQFDSGTPADLTLQTDAAGEIVHVLKFGGYYIGNHFARGTREDGSIVTNNPFAILNGSTQAILQVWTRLGRTNSSFRIQNLDIDYESNRTGEGRASAEDAIVKEVQVFHDLGVSLTNQGALANAALLPGGVELEDRQLITTERDKEGSDTQMKPTSLQELARRGSLRNVEIADPSSLAYGYSTLHAGYFPDASDVTGLVPPLYLTARYMPNADKASELTMLFDPKENSMDIRKIRTELRQRPVTADHPLKAASTAGEGPSPVGGFMAYIQLFHDVAEFLKAKGDFQHAGLLHSHASFRHTGPPQRLEPTPAKGTPKRPFPMLNTIQELAERGALRDASINRPIKLTYSRRYSRSALQRVMPPGRIDQSELANMLFLQVRAQYLGMSGETCELTVEFFQRGDEVTIQRVNTRKGHREEYRVVTVEQRQSRGG